MVFEVVNHVHGEGYARLLAYQLSSLVLFPPAAIHQVIYTLCVNTEDKHTADTIEFFANQIPTNIVLKFILQPIEELRQRAIGRNRAAVETVADWVWFCDTDYIFGRDLWAHLADEAAKADDQIVPFIWPKTIRQTDWPTGDRLIMEMTTPGVKDISDEPTIAVQMHRAIGGLQIINGMAIKREGYCSFMNSPSGNWNFRSDSRIRRRFPTKTSIELPQLIRIRHSRKGYFGQSLLVL